MNEQPPDLAAMASALERSAKRVQRKMAARAKERRRAARGTKHPAGATKANPTPDQRAARRKAAKRSRRKNR